MKSKKKSPQTTKTHKTVDTTGKNNTVLKVVLIVVGVLLLFGLIGTAVSTYVFGSLPKRTISNGPIRVKDKMAEIKGQDGDSAAASENAKLPEGFPADIPLYPGAKIIMANKNDQTYTATLTSTDEYSKVMAYYKAELAKNGWVDQDQNTSFGSDSGQTSTYNKGNRGMIFILSTPSAQQKVTGISIVVTTKTNSSSAN